MAETAGQDLSNDVALLSEGEDTSPETVETKVEGKVEPEIKEDKPKEEEQEDKQEEEIEAQPADTDLLPYERPTTKQIEAKYPELFKDFPSLRHAFFREQEFSKLFPSMEDAKVASENVAIFNDLQADVLEGTGERLLNSLKEADSLKRFSTKFLSNLNKVDRDLHWEVIAPVLEDALRAFYREGKTRGSEDITNAADHLAIFLFGDPDVASGKKSITRQIEEKEPKVDPEQQKWRQERVNTFRSDVYDSCIDGITPMIQQGIPAETSKFMKDALTKSILTEVDKLIASDKTHQSYVDKLWDKAIASGFNKDSKTSITAAYLARAKSLIPSVRRRLITEAGIALVDKGAAEVTEKVAARREPSSGGKAPNSNGKSPSAKQIDWRQTSDLDLLNDNVTLKK